ncbi:MAG TPA: class I SAM-dependent methyltransferase [Planctomycetaceae bacterium]|nr:class I SAM-dependent methyltransferase [Planctomycetaceae bacterium]
MLACNLCDATGLERLYRTERPLSITSLAEVREITTEVSLCAHCGHIQTPPVENLEHYYESDYRILLDSDDEDQLYSVENGRHVYRSEHQAETLLRKLGLPAGARILEYGCAKGATARRLLQSRPDLELSLFDISHQYEPFWQRFRQPTHWATHALPDDWTGRFDAVASFFVLEHITDPRAALEQQARLLKPAGRLYFLVPSLWGNPADLIVADHVNHFTRHSLATLLAGSGLAIQEIDETSHAGAFIVIAVKQDRTAPVDPSCPTELAAEARVLGRYWSDLGQRIREFENGQDSHSSAIYGSGFYGTFIATNLAALDRVDCVLDRNPYRQGAQLLGRPIVAPEQLPEHVRSMYVGLNPAGARAAMQATGWGERPLSWFYL